MFQKMREIESRGLQERMPSAKTTIDNHTKKEIGKGATLKVLWLFLIVILGIFAS